MDIKLRCPPLNMADSTTDGSLRPLISYLNQTVEELNLGLEQTGAQAVLKEIATACNTNRDVAAAAGENPAILANYDAIKELIIKTADYAAANSQSFALSLRGQYVAISDFGSYFENATVTIDGDPYGITQLYNYSATIDSVYGDYKKDVESYIRTGLLYYNSANPVYGVAVGNIYNNTTTYGLSTDTAVDRSKTYYALSGGVYTEAVVSPTDNPVEKGWYEQLIARSGNLYACFTPTEIAFWNGGTKRASITATSVYFPYAEGVFGPWTIGSTAIYYNNSIWGAGGGMYFGTDGLSLGSTFKVSTGGNLTATNATLSSATISGTLTAGANSQIGPWTVTNTSIWYGSNDFMGNGMYFGTSGLNVGGSFRVDSSGNAYASSINITGNSTFTGEITAGTIQAASVSVNNAFSVYNSGVYYGSMGCGYGMDSSATTYGVKLEGQNSNYYLMVSGSGVRMQAGSNYFYLSSAQMHSMYSLTVDSDRRMKTKINYDMTRYEGFFRELQPCRYQLKAEEGDCCHLGLIAQDVEKAMAKNGVQSNHALLEKDGDSGYYGICYGELIALNTHMIQRLYQRVDVLEQQLQQLQ